jgi:hypothetical protein
MLQRILPTSPRYARRPVKVLPIIACLPGEDVWFLRLALAFLSHLRQGGHVTDRLTGRLVGNQTGRPFNFDHLRGGPLFWLPGLVGSGHVFIGHTICPGFGRISSEFAWWADTPFCAPGYDYLHDGIDYGHVPVDLAPHAFVPVAVRDIEAAAWAEPRQRAVFVPGDPVNQAAAYFSYCRAHPRPAYRRLDGRPLADWSFRDYLLRHALPSYAKVFVSYQAMARAVPGSIRIVTREALLEQPTATLGSILSHLTGGIPQPTIIAAAVDLARRNHITALELELGRRLDGSRARHNGAAHAQPQPAVEDASDPGLRHEALALLVSMGVDMACFPAPLPVSPPPAVAGADRSA